MLSKKKDSETVSKKQQILMNYKLRNSEQARNRKIARNKDSLWYQKVNKTEQELNITNLDYHGKIGTVKVKVRKKAREYLRNKIEHEAAKKSKVTSHLENKEQWNIGMRSPYMNQLTRKQVSTIFKLICKEYCFREGVNWQQEGNYHQKLIQWFQHIMMANRVSLQS